MPTGRAWDGGRDLATEAVKGRPDTLVPPLRQLGAVADQVKFGVAKDVVPILIE